MKPLLVAHRGGAQLWPENTLFAFARAIAMGCDGAELDVQLTRDGVAVVFHDIRLKAGLVRDLEGNWLQAPGPPLVDCDYSVIRDLSVGRPARGSEYARSHPDLEIKDFEYIPSLAQVIQLAKSVPDFHLFIELKISSDNPIWSAPPEMLADAVIGELKSQDFLARATLISFDWRCLAHIGMHEPHAERWYLTDRNVPAPAVPGFSREQGIVAAIRDAGGKGWFANHRDATSANIRLAHDAGLQFGAWTVNETKAMRAIAKAGADMICTDRPDRLAKVLER